MCNGVSRVCFIDTLVQMPCKSRGQSTENGTQTPNVKTLGLGFRLSRSRTGRGGKRHRISQGIVKSVVWPRSRFTAHGNQTVAEGGQQFPPQRGQESEGGTGGNCESSPTFEQL